MWSSLAPIVSLRQIEFLLGASGFEQKSKDDEKEDNGGAYEGRLVRDVKA